MTGSQKSKFLEIPSTLPKKKNMQWSVVHVPCSMFHTTQGKKVFRTIGIIIAFCCGSIKPICETFHLDVSCRKSFIQIHTHTHPHTHTHTHHPHHFTKQAWQELLFIEPSKAISSHNITSDTQTPFICMRYLIGLLFSIQLDRKIESSRYDFFPDKMKVSTYMFRTTNLGNR